MLSFNPLRWLKYWLSACRARTFRKKPRLRLWVENLESRLAPTTYNWSGGGSTANWSDPNNWGGSTINPAQQIDLNFDQAGVTTINNIAGLNINSITFSATNVTLQGDPFNLGNPAASGSPNITLGGGDLDSISAGMNIQLVGPTAGSQQFIITNSLATLTINSQIIGSPNSQLTKEGLGTLVLMNDDSGYVGPFTINTNGGIVQIQNSKALGGLTTSTFETLTLNTPATSFDLTFNGLATGAIAYTGTTADAAAVQTALDGLASVPVGDSFSVYQTNAAGSKTFYITLLGTTWTGASVAQQVTGTVLVGTGTFSAPSVTAGGQTPGGTSSPTNFVSVGDNAQLQLSSGGAINVANTVHLFGLGDTGTDGPLENLTGNNTWSGSIVLEADTSGNMDVVANSLLVTGVISDSAGESLTKTGVGQLILDNANTYRGSTNIQDGILTIENPLALGAVPAAGTYAGVQGSPPGQQGTLQLAYVSPFVQIAPTLSAGASSLTNGTTYYYLITAVTASSATIASNVQTIAPTAANQQVNLSWTPVAGATSYNVYRSTAAGNFTNALLATVAITTYIDAGTVVQNGTPAAVPANLTNYILTNSTLPFNSVSNPYMGFVVPNYTLFASFTGFNGSTLENVTGNNAWSGPINLESGFSTIGVDLVGPTQTHFSITGTLLNAAPGGAIEKLNAGDLDMEPTIHTASVDLGSSYQLTTLPDGVTVLGEVGGTGTPNEYTGGTTIFSGTISLLDSQGLGPTVNPAGTLVDPGTALNLVANVAHVDSVTEAVNRLIVDQTLTVDSQGFGGNTGGLRSVSGINIYTAQTANVAVIGVNNASIGVDPEPVETANANYFINDYSLTINGGIHGASNLTKVDAGQLILPNANNNFTSTFDIKQGWVTIQDPAALGANPVAVQAAQVTDTVESGAALMFRPFIAGTNFTFIHNLVLQGLGINHAYSLIDQQGALENLAGVNALTSNIQYIGQTGIGVNQIDPAVLSDLTLVGENTEKAPAAGPTNLPTAFATAGVAQYAQIIDTGATVGSLTVNFTGMNGDTIQVYYGPVGSPGSQLLYNSPAEFGRRDAGHSLHRRRQQHRGRRRWRRIQPIGRLDLHLHRDAHDCQRRGRHRQARYRSFEPGRPRSFRRRRRYPAGRGSLARQRRTGHARRAEQCSRVGRGRRPGVRHDLLLRGQRDHSERSDRQQRGEHYPHGGQRYRRSVLECSQWGDGIQCVPHHHGGQLHQHALDLDRCHGHFLRRQRLAGPWRRHGQHALRHHCGDRGGPGTGHASCGPDRRPRHGPFHLGLAADVVRQRQHDLRRCAADRAGQRQFLERADLAELEHRYHLPGGAGGPVDLSASDRRPDGCGGHHAYGYESDGGQFDHDDGSRRHRRDQ